MSTLLESIAAMQYRLERESDIVRKTFALRKHFEAVSNKVRKALPPKARISVEMYLWSSSPSIQIYINDAVTKSPKGLEATIRKLEKLLGECDSRINDEGDSISYTFPVKRFELGKRLREELQCECFHVDVYLTWTKPDDSTCMLVVSGHKEIEAYEYVKRTVPTFSVVCP